MVNRILFFACAKLSPSSSGVDFEAASEIGIQAIHAPGLPGKNAPETAGIIVAQTVCDLLDEGGGADV